MTTEPTFVSVLLRTIMAACLCGAGVGLWESYWKAKRLPSPKAAWYTYLPLIVATLLLGIGALTAVNMFLYFSIGIYAVGIFFYLLFR